MMHTYSFGTLRRQLLRHLAPALGAVLLATSAAQAQAPSFTTTTYGSGGTNPNDVAVGDVNGDGRLDIVTPNFNSASVAVLLGQAGGTFGTAATYNSGGTNPAFAALGDVNGDSRLDIVTPNYGSNTVAVLLGQAGGSFGTATTYSSGGVNPIGVALTDVNGDGRLDIVTPNASSNTVGVLLGQAGGSFAAVTTYSTGGSFPFAVAVSNLNGDTRPDIVVTNGSGTTVGVLLGQAGGGFGTITTYGTGGSSPYSVLLADVNNDSRLDILTGNGGSNNVSVLLGTGTGTFGTAATYAAASAEGIALGDVNGDNRPDLVVGNYNTNNVISILLGQAGGTFGTAITYGSGGTSTGSPNPYEVALGDFNNDGRTDIVVSNVGSSTIGVLLNTTTFTAPFLSGISPTSGPVGTSVTLSGARLTGATVVSFNGTAASTFSVVNDGTLTATVPTGATTGNVTVTTSGGPSNGVLFAVNPTVTLSSGAGASGSTTNTTPIPFTATFSQSVTGFDATDVTVTNGAVTSGSFSGSGTTYSFTVTPTTSGTPTTVSIAANVAQTSTSTGNAGSNSYSIQYNAPVTTTTWTGAVGTDWFAAGNWTAGVPTATVDATIPSGKPNNPVIGSGAAVVKNLFVNTGATFTQSGGTLTVSGTGFAIDGTFTATGGDVILNASTGEQRIGGIRTALWNLTVGPTGARLDGPLDIQRVLTLTGNLAALSELTLLSNAAGTAMIVNNGGAISGGTTTVQRYIDPSLNGGLGYRHYSLPVQSGQVSGLATTGFSPVVNDNYNTAGNTVNPFPTVFGYDESRITGTSATTQTFERGYFSPSSLFSSLTVGRGYTVNINAGEKVALSGIPNNGPVTVNNLTRGTEANSGWQLLGNPYPAPLDWNVARGSLPTGVQDAIYVYKSSGQYDGTYQTYVNGFGTLPGGLVPSMQGFFLRVSQTVPSFSFQNSWRATTYQNPTFNRATADTRPAVQLDLVSAQGTHEPTFVYFEQGATAGFDAHYDAEKLPNTTGLNLSSQAVGLNLAVNGLLPQNAPTTVPLTVGVPTTGTYTLTAAALLNLATTDVYLYDAETGQQINLKQQPSYSFTASNAALITGRFSLSFGPLRPTASKNGLSAASVSLYPNPAHKSFTLLVPAVSGESQAQLMLLNVLGQPVRTAALALPAAGAQTTMDVQNLPAGVYVLRIQAGTTTVTKQVVVD